ncbi:MAG TPA: class I SAM-dependent methyltransferase [Nitrospiria bacterium]
MGVSQRELVKRFFTGTGPSYDFMVHFGTAGSDWFWKKRILSHVPADSKRVLDLACGTGILTFGIARKLPDARVIGVDITKEYLDIALEKLQKLNLSHVEFIHKGAEDAFYDEPFDCVTASYLAKYADLDILTKNVHGMLKPGGVFVMHDFTYPSNPVIGALWEFYFKLQQTIGILFYPKWRTIYKELPVLLRKTNWITELTAALKNSGFEDIKVESLTLGGAAIVTARKI